MKPKRPRDPRLDFFRGLTMFIIFIAHVPDNSWNGWIPARFGFSSGSELFVFCSGAASAIAFGGIYASRGWWLGTARIGYRIWQVYWAHIGVFVALLAGSAAVDHWLGGATYVSAGFGPILLHPADAMLHALTLTWLPTYIDILPMYIAILAMIPAMMALRRVHWALPFALSIGLYGLDWVGGVNFLGEPWAHEGWFFNPFGWQLVFFTGFFLMRGWIPAPPLREPRLLAIAGAVVVLSVPVSFWWLLEHVETLQAINHAILPANEKTDFYILRYVHFMAVVYLTLSLIEPYRQRLSTGVGRVLVKVGQQSLATFLASLVFARIAGVYLDLGGRGPAATALANLVGFAGIVSVAALVGWVKSAPWAQAPAKAEPAHTAKTALEPDGKGQGHSPLTLRSAASV